MFEQKYELILPYKGSREGAIDFAREIKQEFGCLVSINEVDDDGNIVEGLIDWLDKPLDAEAGV